MNQNEREKVTSVSQVLRAGTYKNNNNRAAARQQQLELGFAAFLQRIVTISHRMLYGSLSMRMTCLFSLSIKSTHEEGIDGINDDILITRTMEESERVRKILQN